MMDWPADLTWFLILLPLVSFLYAAVGHGGASGYLALMALFSFAPEIMKPTALLLNLFVAGAAFAQYYRKGHFNARLFLVFALASIPLAYLGGRISLETALYRQILGVLLLFAVLKLLGVFGYEKNEVRSVPPWQGIMTGGVIGFFSGLIGIGGGIILTPIILLFHWGKMKEAACVSALFIWVNSAAGLAGQIQTGVSFSTNSLIMILMALIGGTAGAYLGSKHFSNQKLRQLLAVVLVMASAKLLFMR